MNENQIELPPKEVQKILKIAELRQQFNSKDKSFKTLMEDITKLSEN